ncbi:MAG: mercuric transporter MerT family protein [Nitrospirota bacterium]
MCPYEEWLGFCPFAVGRRVRALIKRLLGETTTMAGGLVAAVFASICCIGPVVLATLGVGAGAAGFLAGTVGFLKALLPYRPVFIGLTGLLVGISFYLAYRKPRTACTPGGICHSEEALGSKRALLWMMAAITLALVLAPYWLGL